MAMANPVARLFQFFLAVYQTRPYSQAARARVFVVLILLLWPTFLVVVFTFASLQGRGFSPMLAVGITVLSLVLLGLVKIGKAEMAVPLFSLGLGLLFLAGHFTGDFEPYRATNPLLVNRLFYLGMTNVVLVALLTDRPRILFLTAGIYLAAGAFQVMVLQVPEMEEPLRGLTMFSATRVSIPYLFVVFFLVVLQRINNRSVTLAETASHGLEGEVARRTADLTEAMDRLQFAQKSLVEGEKLAALGRLSANVAHEVNTPLGAILSSVGTVSHLLASLPSQFLEVAHLLSSKQSGQFLHLLRHCHYGYNQQGGKELKKFAKDLHEKLKSRGVDHSADVAEVLAELGLTTLDPEWAPLLQHPQLSRILSLTQVLVGLHRSTGIVDEAASKATEFIKALRRFMHHENSTQEMEQIDVAANIETVLTLLQPEMRSRVTVVRHFRDRPLVWGYPNQLHQVWSNLLHNAVQAMKDGGTLRVSIKEKEHKIVVEVEDSGDGIPSGLKDKIFEPFFTTKKIGEGTGLGLKIVQDFVVQHHGTLDFESEPGRTVFRVTLRKGHPREELEFQ